MREGAHFFCALRGKLALAVEVPEFQPVIEELGLDADASMRADEAAPIGGGAAGLQGPEVGDLGEVGFPVLDLRVEDRTDHSVLPNIHVEGADELQDAFVAAELGVEGFGIGCGIHVDWIVRKVDEFKFCPRMARPTHG